MVYQIKCSWCGKFIGIKEGNADQTSLTMQLLTTSHGICDDCKNKVLDSINKVKTTNQTESKED